MYCNIKAVSYTHLAFFVLSGQWMCQELWKNYVYSKDVEFLHDFSYPILKEAVLFAIDWLVEYEGSYVTCPSASPENSFRTDEGTSSISMGCTMDMAIILSLIHIYINVMKEAYIAENDKNDTYVRSLNINDSVAHISYRMGNAHYEREYFASYPDKLIAASYRVCLLYTSM